MSHFEKGLKKLNVSAKKEIRTLSNEQAMSQWNLLGSLVADSQQASTQEAFNQISADSSLSHQDKLISLHTASKRKAVVSEVARQIDVAGSVQNFLLQVKQNLNTNSVTSGYADGLMILLVIPLLAVIGMIVIGVLIGGLLAFALMGALFSH